ncbi:MAG: SCO family protein [Verrucomicrobia bacterium]|nr:MAG: SCO family protein [Verrucomicrobiota bacterium]
MTSRDPTLPVGHALDRFRSFVVGGRFALFVLALFVFYEAAVLALAFIPADSAVFGTFAEQFRIRCFNYNPNAGAMDWPLVGLMTTEPLFLQLLVFFVWRRQLRELGWFRAVAPVAGSAVVAAIVAALCLVQSTAPASAAAAPEFPGERIRTHLPLPDFALRDQDDQPVSPASLRGRTVLRTTVYSGCTTACTMMLTQIRKALDELSPAERSRLTVVAVSLDPETDTRELRGMTARTYSFDAPEFHFLGGKGSEVNRFLDDLQIVRERRPDGRIEHSTIFFCIDRGGRIAYRLSAGEQHHAWLLAALRSLLAEGAR